MIVITSHSLITVSHIVAVLSLSLIIIVLAHDTHGFHIHLATTAACDVAHQQDVSIPSAQCIHQMSSGLVSFLTRITFFQSLTAFSAHQASKYANHDQAHGEAGIHFATSLTFASGSMVG